MIVPIVPVVSIGDVRSDDGDANGSAKKAIG